MISGYRGSPLGGFDLTLQKAQRILSEHEVWFLPGVNEDLGATAVFGSQIAGLFPGAKYDGALGIWYGKSPGVDRSGDAFKHANFAGVSRTGGVLAVAGDDATAKSWTLPSQSEGAFYDALMRRVERALIGEYRSLLERRIETLTPENYEATVKLAELADGIRGYEEVKLGNVERFRSAVTRMEAR